MTQTKTNQQTAVLQDLDSLCPQIETLYLDLHQHPELSMLEVQTAAKVAKHLQAARYEVTTGIGGTGVVGILHNGKGPTVMLRGDMDALPIQEQTGLPYASKVTMENREKTLMPVSHACGHDIHTSCLVGTAALLSEARHAWSGTLMIVAQPGEETLEGAKAMMNDGLFKRFPRPDVAIGQHTSPLVVGTFAYHPGYTMAASDSIKIRIFGKGSHASMPQNSIDPIMIATMLVIHLQTIVSREVTPGQIAIISIGSIQAGTQFNIIPDEAEIELTVRTFDPQIREQVLAAIKRVTKAEAAASNAPKEPEVMIIESTQSLYNDKKPTEQITKALKTYFGESKVIEIPPVTASEDFSVYGNVPGGAGIPSFYYYLGVTDPQKIKNKTDLTKVPGPHSPFYAPDYEPSLKNGMKALCIAALSMLAKPQ